eukprot:7930242-Pyramimonas_sp.AAC.1
MDAGGVVDAVFSRGGLFVRLLLLDGQRDRAAWRSGQGRLRHHHAGVHGPGGPVRTLVVVDVCPRQEVGREPWTDAFGGLQSSLEMDVSG